MSAIGQAGRSIAAGVLAILLGSRPTAPFARAARAARRVRVRFPTRCTMPPALPITAVNHVARITKRVDASRAFYRDVLGFREVARPNFDFPGAWLYNYGIMIHLIYNEAAGDPEGEIQTRYDHLALHTNDLEASERLLKEHGVPYRKNVVADKNIVQIFCRDPDGPHVELGTYAPTPRFV
jgi:catechol 2,3-dioxygenase-like lactoylglutathione lyase family enzyme